GKPAQQLAQLMLGTLGDFERALCMFHAGAEIATFAQSHSQPGPVQDGRNDAQVVKVLTEFVGVEFNALLEQLNRLPIFTEGVVTLPETEKCLTQHDPIVAFARKVNCFLTKFDGTTLLAAHEMLIASECGVLRAALLVAEAGENGFELIQRAQDPIG